jgi:hypothetical protein
MLIVFYLRVLIMTYEDYNIKLTAYNKAMSIRKSLQMTIRMNKAWITGNNPRSDKRRDIIASCQTRLDNLTKPIKPQKQYGFDVITDDDTYFAPTGNINIASTWAHRELDCIYDIKKSQRQITTDHQGLVW